MNVAGWGCEWHDHGVVVDEGLCLCIESVESFGLRRRWEGVRVHD